MKFYSDSSGDVIIETVNFKIFYNVYGLGVQKKNSKKILEFSKQQVNNFIYYNKFSHLVDLYSDNDVEFALNKLLKLKIFL